MAKSAKVQFKDAELQYIRSFYEQERFQLLSRLQHVDQVIARLNGGTTAITDFADTSWTSATFTTRGALIYNSNDSNSAVMVIDFGGDYTVTGGTFTIAFPTADASNAIIRIA